MRKVNVCALQADMSKIGPRCDCLAEDYIADAEYIYANHVLPFLDVTLSLLRQAGEAGCGIAVTGEDICGLSHFLIDTSSRNVFPALAELSSKEARRRLSELAAEYGMYIAGCFFDPRREGIFNTAEIFSKKGEFAGRYDKTHLPPNELWQVCEGGDLNVIDLDFGRVGIEICYDMMFPEVTEVLSRKGAEIILHPTAGYGWYDAIGEATLRTRANDASVYIVTSKNYVYNSAGRSSVVDYWGQILADAGFYSNVIVHKTVDLDVKKEQPSWFYPSQMSGDTEMRRRKEAERRPELYGELLTQSAKQSPPGPERMSELYESVKSGKCHW